jgi:hypothetical protein
MTKTDKMRVKNYIQRIKRANWWIKIQFQNMHQWRW